MRCPSIPYPPIHPRPCPISIHLPSAPAHAPNGVKKKLPTCKPDPVPARGSMRRIDSHGWPSFIWPLHYYRDLAAYPPALLPMGNIGRAALDRRYTWHFSMQGLPAPPVTWRHRGLLPHIFILTHPSAPGVSTFAADITRTGAEGWAVIFCGTRCERLRAPRRLTGALPYAVRTFLPS